ncbi:hypothetical protein EU244_012720 [Rhodococcus qingshengii]|uniref:hypothetical protein n=1 Tax=Rhodococcus qingshengii TaxID=334542 RepID=UPI0010A68CCF|nr:hypothetical protein [Rhodococcus qingshengii]THJ69964.1 hypothetical protein EU244_20105 [Rhodococcus qingshengii]
MKTLAQHCDRLEALALMDDYTGRVEKLAQRRDFYNDLKAHLILTAYGATTGAIIYLWAIGATA